MDAEQAGNACPVDFFHHEADVGVGEGQLPSVTEGNENSDDSRDFRLEKRNYETRVDNMRMQFAWAAIILAFGWIFVIIYLIFSHAIGALYLRQFRGVLWGVIAMVLSASFIYSGCLILYARHKYRGREALSGLWRRLAPNAALLAAPFIGLGVYLIVWGCSDVMKLVGFDRLSDSVLITLITSTTVSVLGILGAVMFWLFPRGAEQRR